MWHQLGDHHERNGSDSQRHHENGHGQADDRNPVERDRVLDDTAVDEEVVSGQYEEEQKSSTARNCHEELAAESVGGERRDVNADQLDSAHNNRGLVGRERRARTSKNVSGVSQDSDVAGKAADGGEEEAHEEAAANIGSH